MVGLEVTNASNNLAPAAGAAPALARAGIASASYRSASRAALQIGCLILGYMGVYLCRKNFSVAVPLLQTAFNTDKAHLGALDSYATIAYVAGKLFWGPNFVDRFGGRRCFFIVLLGVALFGGASALALSLPMLGACYMANRFFGAGGWTSMVKLAAGWFPARHVALTLAFLCLSIVFGGVAALLLAGQIAAASGNNWQAVLGLPSLVLLLIIGLCWLGLSPGEKAPRAHGPSATGWTYRGFFDLLKVPRLWILCGLSFALTITRETFSFWTTDFFKTAGGAHTTPQQAAFLSIPFDAMGAVGILALGWLIDRVTHRQRKWLLFSILMCVAVATYVLPTLAR
ncbi:MAG TPA: MFS transporter, partial [Candidatus Acidoferrales bacterium]|nr:MFS transporter [Candidatus Acidoferrales bacterium]